jgi:chloramphenicol 3-O phosphotransferase
MFHAVKLFSDLGFDLVVPFIFINGANMLEECVTLLHMYPVLFVHVTCPVEELRRREKERRDRKVGEAETQLPLLVPQDTYDITVDTYNFSVEACADKIIEVLSSSDKFGAFKAFWAQMRS